LSTPDSQPEANRDHADRDLGAVIISESEDYKQCPDCAERVLAAARKCRYCGYRFDAHRRDRGGVLADLIPALIRPNRKATMEEILADWQVKLGEHERVGFFSLAVMDERPGYLLVTSERLIFFAQTSRRNHAPWVEYPLAAVSRFHASGGRLRPRLELRGRDARHIVTGIGTAGTRRLEAYLAEHSVDVEAIEPSNNRPFDPS
jgi:hypothetical protein